MLWDAHMPEESSMDLVRYAVRAHPDTGPGLTGRREKGKNMAKILAVDDEQMFCDLLRAVLGHHGHEVITVMSGADAREQFKWHRRHMTPYDLFMLDRHGSVVHKHFL